MDLGLDMSTPAGELVAGVMLSVAQYERRIIGVRTREGLAEKRKQGVRLGRPQSLPDDVVARIIVEREDGRSFRAIAAGLEADGVPTAQGGAEWHPATVRKVLRSQAAARLAG